MPTPRETTPYSLSRAIRCMVETGGKLDGYEAEQSQEQSRQLGRSAPLNGFFLPWEAQSRSLDVAAGGGAIQTTLGPLIDVLRAKLVLAQLGATVLSDLRRGRLSLPAQTATTTLGWMTEGGTPAPSNPTITQQVPFVPRTTGGTVPVSRRMIDSMPNVERIITNDIMSAIAVEIERVALVGSGGANGEPLGVFSTPGPVVNIGTNGGAMTRETAIAMERLIGNASAEVGPLAWLGSPDTRSALRAVAVGTGSEFLWSDRGTILGRPAVSTTNVPNNLTHGSGTGLTALLLAAFSQLVIALWGPATVIVDIYKFASQGYVYITVLQDLDVNRMHEQAFVRCLDIAQS